MAQRDSAGRGGNVQHGGGEASGDIGRERVCGARLRRSRAVETTARLRRGRSTGLKTGHYNKRQNIGLGPALQRGWSASLRSSGQAEGRLCRKGRYTTRGREKWRGELAVQRRTWPGWLRAELGAALLRPSQKGRLEAGGTKNGHGMPCPCTRKRPHSVRRSKRRAKLRQHFCADYSFACWLARRWRSSKRRAVIAPKTKPPTCAR